MGNHHQLINMCKISEVTEKDLSKINELEKQLNLSKTKLGFFKKTILNENIKFIKLISENQIIGFLQFSFNQSDCDIISIGVIQKLQRKGYGKKLVEYLKSLNHKNIYVEVSANNKNSIMFYQRLNFLKVGLRKKYYSKEKSNAIILKLDNYN